MLAVPSYLCILRANICLANKNSCIQPVIESIPTAPQKVRQPKINTANIQQIIRDHQLPLLSQESRLLNHRHPALMHRIT